MSFMNLLSNNAFTKPGGFSENVNMPLLLAGMGMMSNNQNPMQGGMQGLLGGMQYKRQKEHDAFAKKRFDQQQAYQQSLLNMQQQKFQMAQQQHKQSQAQQDAYQKYISSGNFTPQQQATLSALPMQQGVQLIKGWQTPQEGKTEKGADGYLYFVSGPKAGQRAIPNAQKAPEPVFAGNGMQQQLANTVINYQEKLRRGEKPTQAEDMAYKFAVQSLQRPTTINTPNGTHTMPGIDVAAMTGQQAPQPTPAGPQPQVGQPAPTQAGAQVTPENSPYGFTPKKDSAKEKEHRLATEKFASVEDTLNRYEALLDETGAEIMPGSGKLNLQAAHTELLMEMKELFNLGVLNGPDLELMQKMIIDPTTMAAKMHETLGGGEAIKGQLKIVKDKLAGAKKRISETYGGGQTPQNPDPRQSVEQAATKQGQAVAQEPLDLDAQPQGTIVEDQGVRWRKTANGWEEIK